MTVKETLHYLRTPDQATIALWELTPSKQTTGHVFLTHGTFSNRKICDGIANYLCDYGYHCWIMEWRDHGHSKEHIIPYTLETIAHNDLNTCFQFLFNEQNIPNLNCVLHSAGGLLLSMLLTKQTHYISKVNSITFFGVQAFGAAYSWKNRTRIAMSKYLSALLGYIPARMAGSTEEDESYFMMRQWFNWNLKKQFLGNNGFNYKVHLKSITIPIQSIYGKGDYFIAPKKGCEQFIAAFENTQNELIFAAKSNGFIEDYTHSRLLKSQSAKQELWPLALEWIKTHDNYGNNE